MFGLTGFPGGKPARQVLRVFAAGKYERFLRLEPESEAIVARGGFYGTGIWDEAAAGFVGILMIGCGWGETVKISCGRLDNMMDVVGEDPNDVEHAHASGLPRVSLDFIDRGVPVQSIKDAVLSGRSAMVVDSMDRLAAGSSAGKTSVATAVMNDPDISSTFGANRYWVWFGEARRAVSAQMSLLRGLTGEIVPVTDTVDGREKLGRALSDKKCLIVVDDIRTADQASAFEGLDRYATFVCTARDPAIGTALNAVAIPLEPVDRAFALMLLGRITGLPEKEMPAAATEIATACAGDLVALTMTAAAIDAGLAWEDAASELLREAASVEDSGAQRCGINRCRSVGMAVARLGAGERTALARIASLPEGWPVPDPTIAALWHDLPDFADNSEARRECLQRFVALRLCRREEGADGALFHTVLGMVRDVVGRSAEIVARSHAALINGYCRLFDGSRSGFGFDDGYWLHRLPHHLAESGRRDELRALLFDLSWMRRRIAVGEIHGLVSDTRLCPNDLEVDRLRRALRASAELLCIDPKQLTAQLLGRLRPESGAATSRLLDEAARSVPRGVLLPRQDGAFGPAGSSAGRLRHCLWMAPCHFRTAVS